MFKAAFEALITRMAGEVKSLHQIIVPLGGAIRVNGNDIYGWSDRGPGDDFFSRRLGTDPNDTTFDKRTGGLMYPWDVRVKGFDVWYNPNEANIGEWGFFVGKTQRTENNNTVNVTHIVNEVTANGGVGPRSHANNRVRRATITIPDSPDNLIAAGETLIFGTVASNAGSNKSVYINAGHLLLERVGD